MWLCQIKRYDGVCWIPLYIISITGTFAGMTQGVKLFELYLTSSARVSIVKTTQMETLYG